MKTANAGRAVLFLLLIIAMPGHTLFAQAEFKPWGDIDGIRIKGQLMPFNSRIVVVYNDWAKMNFTAKERQHPRYTRTSEDQQEVVTMIDSLQFTETVKNKGRGSAEITLTCTPHAETHVEGIYFNVSLPHNIYAGAQFASGSKPQVLDKSKAEGEGKYWHGDTREISFTAPSQHIQVSTDSVSAVFARNDTARQQDYIRLYFPVCTGDLHPGQVFQRTYEIRVSGNIDHSPVSLGLDTTAQGRTFAGLGGNFRIQNPKVDREVINYCLRNLRVAWGRVEMPWSNWQPDSATDPMTKDTSAQDIRVKRAMQMAQELGQQNIPVIVTAWFPPAWAVEGKLNMGRSPEGIWGNPLDQSVMPSIYKSITNYIIYLRDHYGVEAKYFSFNESDLGINVRQTAEEHDELIKGLGAYFAAHGLKTKLLLGDNSDATTYKFVYPAMDDPAAQQYIGMVSFHSWRGWDTPTLQKWAGIAKKINKPLLVGEGSIDAAAWNYPDYFQDPSYALEEINLYTRLLTICQPVSILQWQLTSDYSVLKGGGVFGKDGPLEPTQRFWNLKQLACTPQGLSYISLTNDKPDIISCAALGNNSTHIYCIHLVNNGASREVNISGIPSSIKALDVFVTDAGTNMRRVRTLRVKDHQVTFKLRERSFTTLASKSSDMK
jgi:O-glycosyl hydrolase